MNNEAIELRFNCPDSQPDGSDLYTCASDTTHALESLAVALQAMPLQSDAFNAALLAYYELEF